MRSETKESNKIRHSFVCVTRLTTSITRTKQGCSSKVAGYGYVKMAVTLEQTCQKKRKQWLKRCSLFCLGFRGGLTLR